MKILSNKQKGILYLLLAVFCYSIMSVLVRFLDKEIPPISQVFLRYIFSFMATSIFIFVNRIKLTIRKEDIPLILFLGSFGYGVTNIFFTFGIIYTQVSTALLLISTYFIITPIIASLYLKEKITKPLAISILIALFGILLTFIPSTEGNTFLGGLFALGSAILFSIYLVFSKKLNYSSANIMLFNTVLGVITAGILVLLLERDFYIGDTAGILNISFQTAIVTILFGIDNFLSWIFTTKGFKLIDASTGSLILLLEPFIGTLLVALIFFEIPNTLSVIGGLLILTAAIIAIKKAN